MLDDPLPSIQLQAAEALGELGGADAAKGLARVASGKGAAALRRAALVALARVDTAAFEQAAARWRSSTDWLDRAAAAAGNGDRRARPSRRRSSPTATAASLPPGSRRGRTGSTGPDAALLAAAPTAPRAPRRGGPERRRRRRRPRRRPGRPARAGADVPGDGRMTRFRRRPSRRSTPSWPSGRAGTAAQDRVDREFLQGPARPGDYLIRRWAEEKWPEAAARWGPSHPIATGRSLQDYRDLGAPLSHGARLAREARTS